MIIYIDNDYKCHTKAAEGLREVETTFFDGKCKAFIEGYRYIPFGETWTRSDGEVFEGEMIASFIDYKILMAAQAQYETDLAEIADREEALNILGVNVDE